MSKRINEAFFEEYIKLDELCRKKFGIEKMGVTEYITRLNNARFAPSRDEVLPRLVKLRNLRNSLAHDEGALLTSSDITKGELKWLRDFIKALEKKRDPLSLYLRRAHRHARLRRARKYIILSFLGLVAIAAAIITAVIIL